MTKTVQIISITVASLCWLLAHAESQRWEVSRRLPLHPHGASAVRSSALRTTQTPARTAATSTVSPNVLVIPCPEPNSVCGFVPVPVDRRHPDGPKIPIYFEQYFHSNPGPAVSAIAVNLGGPGYTSTAGYRDYFQYGLFAENLATHDLLLVDDRGRGQSGTIDCPDLQHGTATLATAEARCAAQLGDAASRYGTGDVADDMNDVRKALGYDKVDYLGASWGGADAIAFATRYPSHVRSLVLDAPVGPSNVIPYVRLQRYQASSAPLVLENLCNRSMLCSQDHPNPASELEDLIKRVRDQPVKGSAYDAYGNLVDVVVDEAGLLNFVLRSYFETKNETLAAAASLKGGDAAPLLRLAAEGFYTLQPSESGDPTFYSAGAYYATGCSDAGEPWNWSDAVSTRLQKHDSAISSLPEDYFEPFSKAVGRSILFGGLGKACVWWAEPTPSSPIVPKSVRYPSVPTLVLEGDVDDIVPIAAGQSVAQLFPASTFVTVANARHETTGWSQCATTLANRLIETLSPGDTTCAKTPEEVYPALGRFPKRARDARPAAIDSSGVNQVTVSERRVASVAIATMIDALQRSYIGSGSSVCLRGGTFTTSFGSSWSSSLTNCAFATDVIVSGSVRWAADNSISADLSVSGSGTAGGTLHVAGFWRVPGSVGNFQVSGSLGGRGVALLVPEA